DVITPRFENGELKTLGGVMIDCTEQKQAQEALGTLKDHLAKVFQASPVGISISGLADGRLLDANPVFADLTGYSHQELMGHSLVGLGIWEHPDERDALVDDLRSG